MLTITTLLALITLSARATSAPVADTVDPAALRAHLEFLASDLLEGREAGTRGYDLAAAYVASQFAQYGLEPAGTDGYFQPVPIRRSVLVPGSVSLAVRGPSIDVVFTDRDHVVAYPSESTEDERIAAGVVFAGYGIVAPEFGRDDYAKLDVRGKFVLLLGGPPPGFPEEAAAHLGAPATQRQTAAARGAIGTIFIYTPALESRFAFKGLATITHQPQLRWHDAGLAAESALIPSAFIDSTAAAAILAAGPRRYPALLEEARTRAPSGFVLPASTQLVLARRARIDAVATANVAAMLRGSDPVFADEVVVVVSHLDHVGIGVPINGDSIYNGAVDNASGIASTLEVARTLRAARPRRSVLFVAVTAEEKGLIGSDYLATHPLVPHERIVGAVNIDGVMAFWDFKGVVAYGAEHSSMREPMLRALRSMALELQPDPVPSLSIFTRSDHYSFVKRGVPAIFLQVGDGVAADGTRGWDVAERWDDAHLHQPSDGPDQPLDYRQFVRFTELLRRFTLEVANDAQRPRWYEADFFGDRFAPGAPRAKRP